MGGRGVCVCVFVCMCADDVGLVVRFRQTQGGCLILPQTSGQLLVCRENVRPSETVRTMRLGETVLWDGRFIVSTQRSRRQLLRNTEGTEPAPASAPAAATATAATAAPVPANTRFKISRLTEDHWREVVTDFPHVRRFHRAFPHQVRLGLPVVLTIQDEIVAIPHLRVFPRPDIRVSATYWPRQRSLEGLVSEETLDD